MTMTHGLVPEVAAAMLVRGWKFDEQTGAWRKHHDTGAVREGFAADHERWFDSDLADVNAALANPELAEANRANAKGADPLSLAGAAITDAGAKVETTGAAADSLQSGQVANHDQTLASQQYATPGDTGTAPQVIDPATAPKTTEEAMAQHGTADYHTD